MAANAPEEIRSLLKDVELSGVVVITKRKLLWLLGWSQDRPDAWATLEAFWHEVRAKEAYGLRVCEIYDKVILAQIEGNVSKEFVSTMMRQVN